MGTGSFSRVKHTGSGVNHTPPSNAEVKDEIELYHNSLCGPSWPVLGWNLSLSFTIKSWRLSMSVVIVFRCWQPCVYS